MKTEHYLVVNLGWLEKAVKKQTDINTSPYGVCLSVCFFVGVQMKPSKYYFV